MRVLLGALTVLWFGLAGVANAAVLWSGVVGSDAFLAHMITEPRGGTYEFRTTGQLVSADAFAQMLYRSYGGSLDGEQSWGSTAYGTFGLPPTVPPLSIMPLHDGIRVQFYTPPSTAIVSPTECYLNKEHCGYYHNYDYLAVLELNVLFAPGQGGETYTLTRISSAAVPEPAAWAMLVAGFGLIGSAVRLRAARSRLGGSGPPTCRLEAPAAQAA